MQTWLSLFSNEDDHVDRFPSLPIMASGGIDWTLGENGDVIITISTDADPDLIDSLAAEYGKRGDWLNTRRE
jgi:hypothetical protein